MKEDVFMKSFFKKYWAHTFLSICLIYSIINMFHINDNYNNLLDINYPKDTVLSQIVQFDLYSYFKYGVNVTNIVIAPVYTITVLLILIGLFYTPYQDKLINMAFSVFLATLIISLLVLPLIFILNTNQFLLIATIVSVIALFKELIKLTINQSTSYVHRFADWLTDKIYK